MECDDWGVGVRGGNSSNPFGNNFDKTFIFRLSIFVA